MQNLVARHYPPVDQLCLIQDHLNTPTPGSFYQIGSPEEAFQFAQRFALHYTPKKASWLHRAEMEFAVLSQRMRSQGAEVAIAGATTRGQVVAL